MPADSRQKNPSLRVLITAGATREYLDPVRFISNPSTGAMGFALAEAGIKRGHKVTLIYGPTYLVPPRVSRRVAVISARDMRRAVDKFFPGSDCLIMASAVSDWRPRTRAARKIKGKRSVELKLVKNPDIIRSAVGRKKPGQIAVGFALETENLKKNAAGKLREKGLDVIVGNRVGAGASPFGEKRTSVIIVDRGGEVKRMKNVTKNMVARAVFGEVERLCRQKK